MSWTVSLIISASLLVLSIICAQVFSKKRKTGIINPFNTFFAGVFTASVSMFVPVYLNVFSLEKYWAFKAFKVALMSVHNTLRLFIIDGEFTVITDYITPDAGLIYYLFSGFAAVIFVVAPILTFGVVLTFFKNFSAYLRYLRHWFSPVCVFSELNDKSIALAKDLKKNDEKRLIIFTDVYENNDEGSSELIEKAQKIGSILFKKDITAITFSNHNKTSEIRFFITGDNESENLNHVLNLIKKYKDRSHTFIYTFSTDISTELLLNRTDKGEVKVRRIHETQSLISRNIYDHGYNKFFVSAVPIDNGIKMINAVVVGMGLHGTEMIKALSWVGQMDGYRFQLTAFDKDKAAESKFKVICPELMKPELNTGVYDENDACYKITVNHSCDVTSQEFFDSLADLGKISYVFISLGSDDMNIRTAINIRTFLLRNGCEPVIDTVVFDSEKKNSLKGIVNNSNQPYNINFIGDLESSYCEDVVMGTDIEKLALARHMKWGAEDDFWNHEYNYRSSVASAIHKKLKIECGVPGITKSPEDRTEDELWNIRRLEHRRWNAYMRSEGYVYAPTRNNLAKTHHLIKSFADLPLKEQIKDDE